MNDWHNWMWGMHWGWWIFWILFILVVVLAFWRALPSRYTPPSNMPSPEAPPLETLQRRYAAGELTTEEYEERKARLERDRL